MSDLENADYHERRGQEEREAALACHDPAVRNVHAELARRHADRAQAIRGSKGAA